MEDKIITRLEAAIHITHYTFWTAGYQLLWLLAQRISYRLANYLWKL